MGGFLWANSFPLNHMRKKKTYVERDCLECKGWGRLFIKAGIPNITKLCPTCKGTGVKPK